MGCDIHIFLELKDSETNKFYYVPNYGMPFEKAIQWKHSPSSRNYHLFTTLADVRSYNGSSFIEPPKGVPEDASSYYKGEVERYGEDGHSHSYHFVNVLLEHPLMKEHENTSFYKWLVYLSTLEYIKPKDLRVCFFFDN